MGLSGPAPSFAKESAFLAKQAFKGIKDIGNIIREEENDSSTTQCD